MSERSSSTDKTIDISSNGRSLDEYIDQLLKAELNRGHPIAESCMIHNSSLSYLHNIPWIQSLVNGIQISHIPKTGVTSFKYEVAPLLGIHSSSSSSSHSSSSSSSGHSSQSHKHHESFSILSQEKCFNSYNELNFDSLTFVRSPVKHIHSMYMHCRKRNEDTHRGFHDISFPRNQSLSQDFLLWLQHFNQLNNNEVGINYDYNCYDPRNFNTRFLSCNGTYGGLERYPHHAHYPPPQLNLAFSNLQKVNFLGITDFYAESVCLFEAVISGKLSTRCSCGNHNEQQHDYNNFIQKDYKTDHLDNKLLFSSIFLEEILKLSKIDQILYPNALLRFLCDVRNVQFYLKTKYPKDISQHHILCMGEKFDEKIKNELGYLNLFQYE